MSMEATSITFNEFFSYAQIEVKKAIDQLIFDEDIKYALEGGKMLRPAMILLSFRACNGQPEYYQK